MKLGLDKLLGQIPSLRAGELELYEKYFEVLSAWNQRMALVSKKSIEFSAANHFADSLFICDFGRKFSTGTQVTDLGSGAGFPGLVMAIRYPETEVQLYEKLLKKQTFLTAAVEHLNLKNVKVAGFMPEEEFSGLILCRAVMPPDELFPFLSPRMTPEATFILNIGGQATEQRPHKDFQRIAITRYTLPLGAGDRQAIAYRKSST